MLDVIGDNLGSDVNGIVITAQNAKMVKCQMWMRNPNRTNDPQQYIRSIGDCGTRWVPFKH